MIYGIFVQVSFVYLGQAPGSVEVRVLLQDLSVICWTFLMFYFEMNQSYFMKIDLKDKVSMANYIQGKQQLLTKSQTQPYNRNLSFIDDEASVGSLRSILPFTLNTHT